MNSKKPIIYEPLRTAGRIKISIPYALHNIRAEFKKLNTTYWHPQQKLWSIVNTKENLKLVKAVFNNDYEIKKLTIGKEITSIPLNKSAIDALFSLEKSLTLKHYSPSTIRSYKKNFERFLYHFMTWDLRQVTKEDIEGFIYLLIKKNSISESQQQQIINAIKAYYELVLKLPREYYNIDRPKKSVSLPNVLSEKEVLKIIDSPKNIKHRAILTTIYSGGLRISEIPNLRIVDIHSDEGYIFIKDSKGKKDRKTILSNYLLILLREYVKLHKPSYWLFEGQNGGKYSKSSITAIFRKAVTETGSNPWATVHTLRHSFATHSIQNNVNLRYIQNMMGHNTPKTTEIYTKTIAINNKNITSPLDFLKNNDNLQT